MGLRKQKQKGRKVSMLSTFQDGGNKTPKTERELAFGPVDSVLQSNKFHSSNQVWSQAEK
jgi:hypothetical protein